MIAAMCAWSIAAAPAIARNDALPAEHPAMQQLVRIDAAIEKHILPRLKTLSKTSQDLATKTHAYCRQETAGNWQGVQQSFAKVVAVWASVSHLRFGPLTKDDRVQRISFWPDPRNIVWRQIRRLERKQDQTIVNQNAMAKQSVAVQGLSALAYLFERIRPNTDMTSQLGRYRCDLSAAITKNVASIVTNVELEWRDRSGWQKDWKRTPPASPAETQYSTAMTDLVKSLLLGFQSIREQQVLVLQNFLKDGGKLTRLPFYNSGLSSKYLKSSIEGTCELLGILNLGVFAPRDNAWIRGWIPEACRVLRKHAVTIEIPRPDKELSGNLKAFDVRQLRFYTNGLRQIIGRQIAPNAGVTIGFNELDGD